MPAENLSNLRAFLALLLLGLSLPCLARAYARAFEVWRTDADLPARRLLAAAVGAAAVARWVVAPKQLVTIFIGYLLTEQAIELSAASHYGMGSLALYHALFAAFPRDHLTLLWTNAVVGVLTLPLAATFAARYLRSPGAGAAFAVLVALVPLFIKNDASEANQVPCLWWLFGGLVLWEEYLATGHRGALAGAVPLVALAANARPEMPLLIPLLFALLTFGLPRSAHLKKAAVPIAAAVAALLVVPHALHVLGSAVALEERDSLPGASAGGVLRLLESVVTQNTVLTPSLYPITLALLALAALIEPLAAKAARAGSHAGPALAPLIEVEPSRAGSHAPLALAPLIEPLAVEPSRAGLRSRAALAIAAVLALATYGLDLCRANMARVHVLGALLVTMLAAAAVASLWQRLRHPAARAALGLAIVAASAPTAAALWAPTNEQAEEDFLRLAMARLPPEPYTFVRMDRSDRDRASKDSNFTHHHFPDYLVRPPGGHGRVSSIVDWIDRPDFDRPAYFYLGVRCYAEFRPAGAPPPRGEALQPACARMRARFTLEPVLEKKAPNRGDVWLDYYGDAPELALGLYRVRPLGVE